MTLAALLCITIALASSTALTNVPYLVRDAAPDIFERLNTLDTSFKNPCFRDLSRQLRCLPYFNILGLQFYSSGLKFVSGLC